MPSPASRSCCSTTPTSQRTRPTWGPYPSASHAIFVLESAKERYDRIDEVPPALRCRTLSMRAFNSQGFIVTAELVEGRQAERLIQQLLANPEVDYVQAHYAKYGCYAARIERA